MVYKRIWIELEEDLIKELKKIAKEERVYLSKFVQQIIEEGLKSNNNKNLK